MSQAERKVKSLSELEDEYRQRWGTPRHVPQNIRRLFGDEWTLGLDVCAEEWSAKARRWFGPGSSLGEDCFAVGKTPKAQSEVWIDHATGGAVFCNPQFNTIPRWVDVLRCVPEVRGGKAILWGPTRSDQGWWRELRRLAAKSREKRATALAYAAANSPRPPKREGTRLCCRLTRVAPRGLDKDNLGTATKYVQDELCRCLGLARANGQAMDEGDVITFMLHQAKGGVREYAVDVHLWLELVV